MIGLARALLVDRNVARIGAHDQEIAARLDTAVAGAGRQHDDVARLDREHLALRAAEFHPGMTASDAQHLVRRAVEMDKRINSVAPAASPAVGAERPFERHGWITVGPYVDRTAIDQERQARIVG